MLPLLVRMMKVMLLMRMGLLRLKMIPDIPGSLTHNYQAQSLDHKPSSLSPKPWIPSLQRKSQTHIPRKPY